MGFNLTCTRRFLTELRDLIVVPEIQTSFQEDLGRTLGALYQAHQAPNGGFITLPAVQWRELVKDAQGSEDLAEQLSYTFYHFRSIGGATERIYLHVTMMNRARVVDFLLQDVLPLAGVSNIKVAPPSSVERFDTIVIYLADQAAVNAALARIATYQTHSRALFEHGSPRLLKLVSEYNGVPLIGVAVGAEPQFDLQEQNGLLYRLNRPSSFGTVRSVIIDFCLRHELALPDGNKQHFINSVLHCLRQAGIDPRMPFTG